MFLQHYGRTSLSRTVGGSVCVVLEYIIKSVSLDVKMMKLNQAMLVLATTTMVMGQRGSFAGTRPIGYPDITTSTTTPAADTLGNRFGDGENAPTTTTQRLPIEANGDRGLVERLSKLPIDNQPFWFINWKAIEEHRKHPQTYPQKPNDFAPLVPPNNFQGGSSLANANVASTTTTAVTNPPAKTSNSGTRDVDVSALMNNKNGLLGASGVSDKDNSNTAFSDNRDVNVASIQSYPSKPNEFNTNLQAQTSSVSSTDQSAPQVAPIFNPAYPDIPIYPILDPKTRDPEAYSPVYSNNARPMLLRNRFSDYEFEEQGPVFVPYGYSRFSRPMYYFK